MSTKAHVVIEFGKTRVELYRHWGGDLEITGTDLLEKLCEAPEIRERQFFHEGGYLLRLLLSDSDGSLPQYQVIDGEMGQCWTFGYYLKYTAEDSVDDTPVPGVSFYEPRGYWSIYYAEIDESDTLDDWLPSAKEYTVEDFTDVVSKALNDSIMSGKVSDYDAKQAFLDQLRKGK